MDQEKRACGNGLVLIALSLLSASTLTVCQPPKEFSGLLQQEEHAEQARRVILGDWCQNQLTTQTAQRNELRALRDQVAPLIGDDSNLVKLSLQEANLGRQLEQRQSDAAESEGKSTHNTALVEDLKKQADALSRVQGKVSNDWRGKTFLQSQTDDGGAVVARLLHEAQTELQQLTAELAQHQSVMLQKEVTKLEAEYKVAADGLAGLRTRQLAARKSQELITAALEEQESFLTDLNDICELGQQVYGRFETRIFASMKDVAKDLPALLSEVSEAVRAAAAAPRAAAEAEPASAAAPVATDVAPTALLQPETDSNLPATTAVGAASTQPLPIIQPAVRARAAPAAPRARQQHQQLPAIAESANEVAGSTADLSLASPSDPSSADSMRQEEPPAPAPKVLKHSRSSFRRSRKEARRSPPVVARHVKLTTTSAPEESQDDNVDVATATSAVQTESPHNSEAASASEMRRKQFVQHGTSQKQKLGDSADSREELADNAAATQETPPVNADDQSGSGPTEVREVPQQPRPAARRKMVTTTRVIDEPQDADAPSTQPAHSEEGDIVDNAAAVDETPSESQGDSLSSAPRRHAPQHRAQPRRTEKERQRQPLQDMERQRQPLQDMVDVAAGASQPIMDDKSKATMEGDDALSGSISTASSLNHDTLPSSSGARSPKGLEGGWRSFLKGGNRKKKRKVHDQNNGIMDLVNTPTTYTAWHPEHSDAQYTASAKSDLKAAEAAFDAPDDGPSAFLQLKSKRVWNSRRADTAKLILEEYADVLKSPTLLQLARAQLSGGALQSLWKQLQSVNISVARNDHEAQSVQWCCDFQGESKSLAQKTRAEQRQATLDRTQADTELLVLSQEIKAHSHFLQIASNDERSLHSLMERMQHQFDSAAALLQQFQGEASGILNELTVSIPGHADVQAHLGSLQESLGRLQGEVDSSNAEITDIIGTAASRRAKALANWKANLAQARSSLTEVQHRKVALVTTSEARKLAKDQDRSLRDRYNQMCQWVLGEYSARQRQQESEERAIKAALVVLNLL